jgi:hypothetical protein
MRHNDGDKAARRPQGSEDEEKKTYKPILVKATAGIR